MTDILAKSAAPRKGPVIAPAAEGAANGAEAGAGAFDVASPLSMLISRHMFQEGEIIELAVRPSSLWIVLTSWRTLIGAAILILAGSTLSDYLPGRQGWWIEAGMLLGAARLMWATIRWMSRLHVLTNLRVMTISGVFTPTVTECPLRKLARVRDVTPIIERVVLVGSLELIPMDEHFPVLLWQQVRRPAEVQRKIRAAIEKAKHH